MEAGLAAVDELATLNAEGKLDDLDFATRRRLQRVTAMERAR